MADLSVLRTTKQALDEGLLTQQDFDVVKVAFLKAQQIKAGLDAGFIRQEDYDRARDAFLHALDFQLMTTFPAAAPVALNAGAPPQPRASAPPPAAPRAAAPPPAAIAAAAAAAPPPVALGARGRTSAGESSAPHHAAAASSAPPSVAPTPRAATSNGGAGSFGGGGSVDLSAIPKYGQNKGVTAGKVSMAGISVTEDCVNLFTHMKTRSAYKWATFRIDDSGTQVIVDALGAKNSAYADFVAVLPEHQCRYGVYDYEYISPERGNFSKLVFVNWAPDTAQTRTKMMYASTKDFLKGFLDGVGAELQATEPCELGEDEMRERVVSNMTRK